VNTVAAAPPRSRTGPALWLVATQALALVSLVAWLLVAGFSFIASGGDGVMMPRPMLWALWAYPVLPLACTVLAWRAFRRGDTRRAVTLATVQLAAAVLVLAFVGYMAAPVG
jgi:hypothetical protein